MSNKDTVTREEINNAIEAAKSENPQIGTVLGLMDLTYNEGVDDCIDAVNKFLSQMPELSEPLVTKLSKLKK
jgi:hypothetical protein